MTIEVDNTAKAGGLAAALLSWLSGAISFVFHPVDAGPLVQIVIAIIGGLCGIAGAGFTVLVKHWIDSYKNRKNRD